jgi:hypothetical protein
MQVATFAGTVTDCRTRFQVDKPMKAFVTHFDANWIVTLQIEATTDGLPVAVGVECSFMIHSPVQLLFDSAEDCAGKRYELAVEIDDAGKVRWQTLRRARLS